MIGEGEADVCRRSACRAARRWRLPGSTPIVLGAKEGLALINGTQFSTACALAGLFDAWAQRAARRSLPAALSTDAIMGSTAPLIDAESTRCAAIAARSRWRRRMRALMAGSEIRESHRQGDSPRAGPLLHPLPAAGDRRGDRSAAPGRRQRWRSRPTPPPTTRWCSSRRARSSRAAISTASRWPSPPTRSRLPSPRSAPSPSAASR